MSYDIAGGINYNKIISTFLCNDYPSLRTAAGVTLLNGIPFTDTETYYTSGLMAYLNNTNVVDVERGWGTFTHGQPGAPAYLATVLTALNVVWPATVPAFEAKDTLFYSTEDCWVRFNSSSDVQHFIPATTYMRFRQRYMMFFVVRDSASGVLRAYIEG